MDSALDLLIPVAHAQAAGAAQPNAWLQLLPLVLIFVVFYFLLIRPQTKKAKEHREMVSKLSTGDEVVTAGGILGRLTDVGESVVTLEIANGVQIKVQRFQVVQLLPKGSIKGA